MVIIERSPNDLQRTFTSVVIEQKTPKGESKMVRAYVDTEKALDDPDLRQQILAQAVNEAERWAAKYRCTSQSSRTLSKPSTNSPGTTRRNTLPPPNKAGLAGLGQARLGMAWIGLAGHGRRGRRGRAWLGRDRHRHVKAG